MASNSSAPTSPSPSDRYFCHRCVREVDNINQDAFTCPFCNQGFLEQISSHAASQDEPDDDEFNGQGGPNAAAVDFNEFLRNIGLPMLFPGLVQPPPGATTAQQFSTNQPGSTAAGTGHRPEGRQQQSQQQQPPPQQQPLPWQGFLQNLLEGLAGAAGGGGFQVQVQFDGDDGQPQIFGYPFPLHGNPGDYAWGPGGLDAIVTRLLNQFEGGAPPLTEVQIQTLPQVEISQDQVDKRLQCTVCMDDFKLQEKVRRLPCGHHFHDPCIVPWLSRHNTCPVCRKEAVTVEGTGTGSGQSGPSGGPNTSAGASGTNRPTQGTTGQHAWDAIEELD